MYLLFPAILLIVVFLCKIANKGARGSTELALYKNRKASHILCMSWYPAMCYPGKRACLEDSYRPFWTIHGLWAAEMNCFEYETFSVTTLESVMSDLHRLWPSYYRPSVGFWQYEWRKHGTCFRDNPLFGSLFKYFSQTLRLAQRTDVASALSARGITVSDEKSVSKAAVVAALREAHGGVVYISCIKVQKRSLLNEIHMCVDNMGEPTDCVHNRADSCGENVYYVPLQTKNKGLRGI